MTSKTALSVMTALALLSACNRGGGNNSAAANKAATNGATTAANAASPDAAIAAGQPVDQAFVTGTWGAAGCASTFSFNADGTATNSRDPSVARWSLEGGTLTVTPPGQPPQRSPVSRNGDNLLMNGGGTQVLTLNRCPAAAAGAPAPGGAEKADSDGGNNSAADTE